MNKVIVFGSFVVDLMARAPHLPIPGETVKSSMFKLGPGGKGFNQGIAANRAGANVTMISKIGNDSFGQIALDKLKEENMNADFMFKTDKVPTGTALIMVDEKTSQNQIMVTLSACSTIDDEDIEKIKDEIKQSSYILTQLETNVDAVYKLVNIANENGVKVILNPAPVQQIDDELYKKIDIITPNEVEAAILTGVEIKSPEDALKAADVFFEKGVNTCVITLGKMGVLVATKERHEIIKNYDVKVLDTTGAGDAFSGGFLTALSEGKDIWEAAKFANVVSNIAVTRLGTAVAMPKRQEVDEFIKLHGYIN